LKFRLQELTLGLKREDVVIPFADANYFWGQMGAGKTSIARLIDYCLGGKIELTPALQSEFVSATLTLSLAKGDLALERERDSDTHNCEMGGTR
jgi:Holliday junction resolvasome RuvABC ATP-dependent DNA helicase subunit